MKPDLTAPNRHASGTSCVGGSEMASPPAAEQAAQPLAVHEAKAHAEPRQEAGRPHSLPASLTSTPVYNPFEVSRRAASAEMGQSRLSAGSEDENFQAWVAPPLAYGSQGARSLPERHGGGPISPALMRHMIQTGGSLGLAGDSGPPDSPHSRLTSTLLNRLATIGEEVRDIKIFHFLSHQDPHTVDDIRRAAQWVAGHPDGVGRVCQEGLFGRWPDEMDRLPKLAIALGLERLKLSGSLGMPTFEHEDTGLLLGQVRHQLDACLAAERQPITRLQERLMRALVGAEEASPSRPLHTLRLSVEELAARPRHNQRDYVAMAIELALDEPRAYAGA